MELPPQTIGANAESSLFLAIGLEQEGVRACLLDTVAGRHRLIGWLGLQNDGSLEPAPLIASACRRLGRRLGCTLWNEQINEPLVASDDALRIPPLAHVSIGLLLKPALRTWLAGVTPSVSLATLERAVTGAPVQIVGRTVLTSNLSSTTLAAALAHARPDVLVVAGGFDDAKLPAQAPLIMLCRVLGQALAAVATDVQPALFYAGNRYVAPTAVELLVQRKDGLTVTVVDNIMPSGERIQQQDLVRLLNYHDWRLNERAPGFGRFSRWVTSPGQVSSLAANFVQLARAWLEHERLTELRGLYCTTHWWLHVLAEQGNEGVHLCYAPPGAEPALTQRWPAVRLISGPWQGIATRPAHHFWWDPEGLAPIVVGMGQVAPQAMMEVLAADLLLPYRGEAA